MADIGCDVCGQEQAVLIQSDLISGATMAVGRSCLLPFALGLAITFSDGAEPEEQAVYADTVAALLANLAPSMLQLAKSAVPRPPRRKAADKGKAAAQDGQQAPSDAAGQPALASTANTGPDAP